MPFTSENSSVQLLLSLGMIITGTSVVIIWRLASRKVGFMLRSSEFHIYLSLILGATFLIFFWADEGADESARYGMASKGLSPHWFYLMTMSGQPKRLNSMANNSQNDGIKCDAGFQPRSDI